MSLMLPRGTREDRYNRSADCQGSQQKEITCILTPAELQLGTGAPRKAVALPIAAVGTYLL